LAGDSITSIELAMGGAVAILGARTINLFRAASAVPQVHAELLNALKSDDPQLERIVRRLGFRSPYAEVAGTLIRAARNESQDERQRALQAACHSARAQVARRFQRDQSLDLIAIAVAIGLGAFAREGLPEGTWFWGLAAALIVVLVVGLAARARLRSRIDDSLERLAESIAQRPSAPPRPPLRTSHCPTCGHELTRGTVTLQLARGTEPATALLCDSCGYVQATIAGATPVASA
jgi:hypothetical protein